MGHPDKLCDLIADSILDACLWEDADSRVACEVMATKGRIIVAGEITCSEYVDLKSVTRSALRRAGYDPKCYKISLYIQTQSPDIAAGVNGALESREDSADPYSVIGAGDQGTMYGYATKETTEMLPLPLVLAHRIVKRLDECRKGKLIKGIFPDGKAQVTVEYDGESPVRVKTVVVSIQHAEQKEQSRLREEIMSKVLWPSFEDFPVDGETEILINPSGRFVVGGPDADTGLTGRKLMVDTYGGLTFHGGGAPCFSHPWAEN
jgi:S-adenosylmethionine synthetase